MRRRKRQSLPALTEPCPSGKPYRERSMESAGFAKFAMRAPQAFFTRACPRISHRKRASQVSTGKGLVSTQFSMRYVMKQKLFSWGDDFRIKNQAGEDVFFVDGRVFSI